MNNRDLKDFKVFYLLIKKDGLRYDSKLEKKYI